MDTVLVAEELLARLGAEAYEVELWEYEGGVTELWFKVGKYSRGEAFLYPDGTVKLKVRVLPVAAARLVFSTLGQYLKENSK